LKHTKLLINWQKPWCLYMQHSSIRTTSERDATTPLSQEPRTTALTLVPIPLNIGPSAKKDTARTTRTRIMKDISVPSPINHAFPLCLKYPEEGYNKVLTESLYEGFPLLIWSKKVAQWNSKLNGFCYLKRFMRKSHAIIANILGPFPEGQKVRQFVAFEHTNTQHLYTDTTGPRTYHYRWAHERALGPSYHGHFNKHGHYGGREYTPQQIALAKALKLKWALKLKPSDATNWRTNGSAEYGRPAPTYPSEITLDSLMKDLKRTLATKGNKEKYFNALIKEKIFSGPQLSIVAGALHIRTFLIFKGNRLDIPVKYHSFKGTQEHLALVDSGAMENFMDQKTVIRLHLGTKKLKYPIPVRNIDGTENRAGHITDFLELIITRGQKKVPARFYVTNLGEDRVILGYPWLRDFNPDIDWPTGKLKGPQVEIETPFYSRFPTMCHIMEK